jgi:glycosyltransferase involved in cell wall biosynthesis
MIHYISTNGVGNAWVGNELRVVTRAGIPVELHSLRKPDGTFFSSADVDQLNKSTRVIYPLSAIDVIGALFSGPFQFRGRFFAALTNALFARRESFTIRLKCLWHFMVACKWARDLTGENVDLIHSQWIHSSGTIGMYGAWLLGVPFGFTGHATDLFRDRSALRDKIKRADYIICISYFHRDFFLIYGAKPEQLIISYCGIDVDQFTSRPQEEKRVEPFTILSSGRLVEKKGFEYLIDACKLLKGQFDFRCIIAGSGELEQSLRQKIEALELQEQVNVTGQPLLQEEITKFMHQGDCYCLPCVWSSDNDVDGLPQMLMEAMACGLPSISTRLVGIPDLVIDDRTGILLEPNNAHVIAEAIRYLHDNSDVADRLARDGRQHVVEKFNLANSVEPLIAQFRKRLTT